MTTYEDVLTHPRRINLKLEDIVLREDAALIPRPETQIGRPAPGVENPGKTAPVKYGSRKLLLAGAAVLALSAASYFGWQYWTVGQFQVSTDDAYVQADSTTVAPKVSGYLQTVLVDDNQRVKAGQVLARIDDRDFKAALDQANADVAAARAAIAGKQAALETQQSIIEAARATSPLMPPLRFSRSRMTSAMRPWRKTAGARCRVPSRPRLGLLLPAPASLATSLR